MTTSMSVNPEPGLEEIAVYLAIEKSGVRASELEKIAEQARVHNMQVSSSVLARVSNQSLVLFHDQDFKHYIFMGYDLVTRGKLYPGKGHGLL